ncbi:hypothetical protein K0M31_006170, partial [Melipona bicolor]
LEKSSGEAQAGTVFQLGTWGGFVTSAGKMVQQHWRLVVGNPVERSLGSISRVGDYRRDGRPRQQHNEPARQLTNPGRGINPSANGNTFN